MWNGTTDLTDSIRLVFGTNTTFLTTLQVHLYKCKIMVEVGTVKFEGSATSNSSNVQITPGTVSKPGLNFGMRSGTGAQDTNTGIFSSAADKMEFATGGSEIIQLTTNGTKLTTLSALSTAASAFLISDGGLIKTRTASQVRSDIGAGTGTVTGSGTANNLPKWSGSTALTDSEISDTGSLVKIGKDASNQETLYIDTDNRKVGFRTSTPGAAFDVNGTIRVRNQLNVGNTTEQNLYVDGNGSAGGKYVKMGNYGQGNYFGIATNINQPKYVAAFGSAGKVVEERRIITIKVSGNAFSNLSSTGTH